MPAADSYLRDPKHGPLPGLLVLLTFATGIVDAVSILSLGRVFVANMTGNIVFIGFAAAGAPGFSLAASLIALAGFLAGAGVGGLLVGRFAGNRARLLRNATGLECVLLVAATVVAALAGAPLGPGPRDVTVALAGIALGIQNAAVRRLAVPDLTTTVLTMTLTGIAADLRAGNRAVVVRRIVAVLAMLGGALVGAEAVLHVNPGVALAAGAGVVILVFAGATVVTSKPADWQ